MTPNFRSDGLLYLLRFPFRQPEWPRKLAILSLVALAGLVIPVVPTLFLTGYCARVMKAAIEGRAPTLPEWGDWSQMLEEGARLFAASLVYALPLIALLLLAMAGMFAPLIFVVAIEAARLNLPQELLTILILAGMSGGTGMIILAMPLAMLTHLVVLAVQCHVVATGAFGAAFRVPEWRAILRANIGHFLAAYAVVYGIGVAGSLLIQAAIYTLVFLCLLPILVATYMAYHALISSVLFGAAYAEGVQKLAGRDDSPSSTAVQE